MSKPIIIRPAQVTYCVTCDVPLSSRAMALRHAAHDHIITSIARMHIIRARARHMLGTTA